MLAKNISESTAAISSVLGGLKSAAKEKGMAIITYYTTLAGDYYMRGNRHGH